MKGSIRLAWLALLGAALLRGQAFSQADLQQWLAVWQQKQQLQDWNIEIRIARRNELGPNVGDVHFQGGKRAQIRVLDAAECTYVPAPKVRRYTELTVAHELVHLSVLPLGKGENDRKVEDRVEEITEALVLGNVPACATPRDFMEAEIVSLPWKPVDTRIREEVIRKLTAALLDGRPSWTKEHTAACASTIKSFFARSGWR
jgi:hypothetical protein